MRQLHLEAQFRNTVYEEYTSEKKKKKSHFYLRGLNELFVSFKIF